MEGINIIRFSENALCSLLLAAIESYTEKNRNMVKPKNLLEIYGSLYGHETRVNDGHRIFHVEMAMPSLTCKQSSKEVSYSMNPIFLKNELTQAFFPHLSFLGDFHTHPYTHFKVAAKNRGYYLSTRDRQDIINQTEEMKGINYRISVLTAISYSSRQLATAADYADKEKNTIRMDFGHFRIWISAYIAEENEEGQLEYSEDNSKHVMIHIPCLVGLNQMSSFGRLRGKGRHVSWQPAALPISC